MRTLQIFENSVEAEILRTRLDAAGIFSVVNGGEVATMLSHIGTAAAKVRVEVAPEDFVRAQEMLRDDELDRVERSAWFCSRCDERNEPLFDLCWNCSKQRGEQDKAAPVFENDRLPITIPGPLVVSDPVAPQRPNANPYAPVRPCGDEENARSVSAADDLDPRLIELVARIFRGAVIATVIVPPLLSLYVLFMLVWQVPGHAYRHPGLRRRLIAAWVLCAVSFVFPVLVLAHQF